MAKYINKKAFPRRHFLVTPSDSVDLPRADVTDGVVLYCAGDGDAEVLDMYGNQLTYAVTVGDIIPILGRRVMATGTTATLYGLTE